MSEIYKGQVVVEAVEKGWDEVQSQNHVILANVSTDIPNWVTEGEFLINFIQEDLTVNSLAPVEDDGDD